MTTPTLAMHHARHRLRVAVTAKKTAEAKGDEEDLKDAAGDLRRAEEDVNALAYAERRREREVRRGYAERRERNLALWLAEHPAAETPAGRAPEPAPGAAVDGGA